MNFLRKDIPDIIPLLKTRKEIEARALLEWSMECIKEMILVMEGLDIKRIVNLPSYMLVVVNGNKGRGPSSVVCEGGVFSGSALNEVFKPSPVLSALARVSGMTADGPLSSGCVRFVGGIGGIPCGVKGCRGDP
ncbi:hypothetical protein TNCV_1767871 [Trichonephila clavipes]|nr:hypothetical protein TNCV_1767871 [Trichonephila clavipes]